MFPDMWPTASISRFARRIAQASGLPVVAFDNGGIPEVVRNGETAFLVPPLDRTAFVTALTRLTDPGLRSTMGEAARRHVVEHHDLSRWGSQMTYELQLACTHYRRPRDV